MKVCVLSGYGINCEEESQAAFLQLGLDAEIVHLKDLFQMKAKLQDYQFLMIPGGFSFGDDLGAGRALAKKMRYKKLTNGESLYSHLKEFLAEGGFIFGVCNGFQVLVSLGLLPGYGESNQVSLTLNASEKFEDRWCHVTGLSKAQLDLGAVRALPVRHKEGRLLVENAQTLKRILQDQLICLRYCNKEGDCTVSYPENPNGSILNCAGLCDRKGQVLGMMPHPEAFTSLYQHPEWGKILAENPQAQEKGEGLELLKLIIEHAKQFRENYCGKEKVGAHHVQ